MVSIDQTTIWFLYSIHSPNYSLVASPTISSGCTKWVLHARNMYYLMMQSYVRLSPWKTGYNFSWSPTAHLSLLHYRRDPLLLRTVVFWMKNSSLLLFFDRQQSVLELHTLWLLSIISYNEPCSLFGNPLQFLLSFFVFLLNTSAFHFVSLYINF